MVAFNAFSAIATSTDVAKEQPKKESFVNRFFGKKEKPAPKPVDGPESPMYSVEWYLLPKQENRAALRNSLPKDLADKVPGDCNEPIKSEVE